MTANVICHSWTGHSGGSQISTTSTLQPWIWAIGPGNAVASDDQDADINKHASYGS